MKKQQSPELGASGSWIQKIFFGTRSGILVNFPSLVDNRLSQPIPSIYAYICIYMHPMYLLCNLYYHLLISNLLILILLILLPLFSLSFLSSFCFFHYHSIYIFFQPFFNHGYCNVPLFFRNFPNLMQPSLVFADSKKHEANMFWRGKSNEQSLSLYLTQTYSTIQCLTCKLVSLQGWL